MQRRNFVVLTLAATASMCLVPIGALAEDTIHITVKSPTGKLIEIHIKPSAKILDLKIARASCV